MEGRAARNEDKETVEEQCFTEKKKEEMEEERVEEKKTKGTARRRE